ncbi:hypothetical protein [Pseudoxanthomonas sp. J35]|uniref:hypothetical protein n=1 Tax=Pseudoxanthomonas sp. J35 TaxID=935852 RepID=UPI00048D2ADB|nr:hypothetical protein [Pseudoxanthomonas sp. J35]
MRAWAISASPSAASCPRPQAEGFDFDLSYRMDTDFGRFALMWQSTYTVRDEIKTDTSPDTLPQQLVGWATSPGFVGTFRVRSNASLSWEHGPWGATWGALLLLAEGNLPLGGAVPGGML